MHKPLCLLPKHVCVISVFPGNFSCEINIHLQYRHPPSPASFNLEMNLLFLEITLVQSVYFNLKVHGFVLSAEVQYPSESRRLMVQWRVPSSLHSVQTHNVFGLCHQPLVIPFTVFLVSSYVPYQRLSVPSLISLSLSLSSPPLSPYLATTIGM